MKNIAFTFLFCSICILSKAQNSDSTLTGKWYSIDGNHTVLLFTPGREKKFYLKKGVKKVPIYNTESARITVNGNLLNEKEAGGGGIDVTYKFDISKDTLIIYYQNNVTHSFKRITDKQFRLLSGRKG